MARPHTIPSNRATEFSKDLHAALRGSKNKLRKKFGGVEWRKNWAIHGGETVDVVGLDQGQPVVLIEAELLREDPSSNVIKIWKWAHEEKLKRPVLFVQSFTKPYRGRKKERFNRARFVAARMNKEFPNITYKAVRLGYNPRPGGKRGAGRRAHHARNLAYTVIRQWNVFQKNL
jgi:hypothetical protein